MTPRERIKKLRKLLAALPSGKWEEREDYDYYQGGTYVGVGPYHYGESTKVDGRDPKGDCYFHHDFARIEKDGFKDLLLALGEDLPALLDVAEAAAEVRRLAGEYDPDDPHIPTLHALEEGERALDTALARLGEGR